MVTIEKPAVNGAELIRRLAETGTGDNKLEMPRKLLGYLHRKEKRVARADELIDAMEKAGKFPGYEHWPATPPLTLEKARAIAALGAWSPAMRPRQVPVEDLILAGAELPPESAPEEAAVEMEGEIDDPVPDDELPPVGLTKVKKKPAPKKKPKAKAAAEPPVPVPPAPAPAV